MLPALPADWPTRFLILAIVFAGMFAVGVIGALLFERENRKLPAWAVAVLVGVAICSFLCLWLSVFIAVPTLPAPALN